MAIWRLAPALLIGLVATTVPLASQARLKEGFFDTNGVRIRYAESGRGEPIVLVHSMSDSIEMWKDRGTFDALAERFRVIAFDSRGYGRSDKLTTSHGTGRRWWRTSDVMEVL